MPIALFRKPPKTPKAGHASEGKAGGATQTIDHFLHDLLRWFVPLPPAVDMLAISRILYLVHVSRAQIRIPHIMFFNNLNRYLV
jgi:hypothetical protein